VAHCLVEDEPQMTHHSIKKFCHTLCREESKKHNQGQFTPLEKALIQKSTICIEPVLHSPLQLVIKK